MRSTAIVALALLGLAGCGKDARYASVSGRITMDDKPLKNVSIQFMPVSPTGGQDVGGYGSSGRTDEDGRFTLRVNSQQLQRDGALVGNHRVFITPVVTGDTPLEYIEPSEDGAPSPKLPKDFSPVPARYNENSELTFAVPPDGTTEANFNLVSDKAKGKGK